MKRKTIDRPAFMFYAANVSAKSEWRRMPFAERGLFLTMLMECWVNQEIPADPMNLASYLYSDHTEVCNLLSGVMWHFDIRDGQIFCPSLEKYRDEQDARIAKQSEGGKRGAAKVNGSRKAASTKDSKYPASTPQVPCESLGKTRPDQTRPTQPVEESSSEVDPFHSEFISSYDKASNGY